MTEPIPDSDHYELVAQRMCEGYVVPFLGAGANLVERPPSAAFEVGKDLPTGVQLAQFLAQKSRYPDSTYDLLRVSQYVDAILGERTLYQYLRRVFDADYEPTSLHRLLAGLPPLLRAVGARHQLIITTNYDDALERAFREAGEEFDLVWYEAKRRDSELWGRFLHRAPDGSTVPITQPGEYDALSLEERTVILKLHGAIDRTRRDETLDSYVITEDNYIDYLVQGDLSVPRIAIRETMMDSHFLFLGYSMRDWNLRVILNRIWGQVELTSMHWAVQAAHEQPEQNKIERKLWARRGEVELFQVPLKDYVANLNVRLGEIARAAGAP